ncbi:hypothetical protein MMC07_000391 [Pseudocyphellaria aurata]|nr:hypothetical protein [Pseudocyphellaria aurata]
MNEVLADRKRLYQKRYREKQQAHKEKIQLLGQNLQRQADALAADRAAFEMEKAAFAANVQARGQQQAVATAVVPDFTQLLISPTDSYEVSLNVHIKLFANHRLLLERPALQQKAILCCPYGTPTVQLSSAWQAGLYPCQQTCSKPGSAASVTIAWYKTALFTCPGAWRAQYCIEATQPPAAQVISMVAHMQHSIKDLVQLSGLLATIQLHPDLDAQVQNLNCIDLMLMQRVVRALEHAVAAHEKSLTPASLQRVEGIMDCTVRNKHNCNTLHQQTDGGSEQLCSLPRCIVLTTRIMWCSILLPSSSGLWQQCCRSLSACLMSGACCRSDVAAALLALCMHHSSTGSDLRSSLWHLLFPVQAVALKGPGMHTNAFARLGSSKFVHALEATDKTATLYAHGPAHPDHWEQAFECMAITPQQTQHILALIQDAESCTRHAFKRVAHLPEHLLSFLKDWQVRHDGCADIILAHCPDQPGMSIVGNAALSDMVLQKHMPYRYENDHLRVLQTAWLSQATAWQIALLT